jgi:GNAT superfamily N-acetyltransferase
VWLWERTSGKFRRRLAPEFHWYLMALGVEPSKQRKGLGTRLIEPILACADSSGLPCYLETFNERNLAFYGRQGFRIAAAGNLPGGPDFWAMIRAPQSS